MSWPTILADRPDLMRNLAVHPEDFDPTCAATPVFAPCCGRKTPAFTVVSLAGLVTEIRGGNFRPKADLDWACDGCQHLLIMDESNGWTWSNLYAALGAPPEVLRHQVAREVEHLATLDANKRDAVLIRQGKEPEGINPQEVYETAYANLPADLSTDRATARPDV